MSINLPKHQSATINSATTGPTLRPWDSGPDVIELQELLRAFGFKVGVTGEFDSYTEDCTLIFQKRCGLRPDAIVGPKTWAAFKLNVKPGTRVLRMGLSGVDVHELQGLLLVNGFSVKRDGFFGPVTRQAVIDFQQQQKLKGDGQVDRITWCVLQRGGRQKEL